MHYKFITTDNFKKEFKKLDNSIQKSILKYIKKIESSENPKVFLQSHYLVIFQDYIDLELQIITD